MNLNVYLPDDLGRKAKMRWAAPTVLKAAMSSLMAGAPTATCPQDAHSE